jgi:RNA polymerase sigma factor FliA
MRGSAVQQTKDEVDRASPAVELDLLWADYRCFGDRETRDRLIIHYSPLVKFVAARISAGLPPSVEQADLVSYGVFGLIDAISKFDVSRNVKFEGYATIRIKGAIIDELRKMDWVPRSVRAKARSVEGAYAKLGVELRRPPTDAEVASGLSISDNELRQILNQISHLGLVPFDQMLGSHSDRLGDSTTLGSVIPDRGEGPEAPVESEDMKRVLAAEINRLGDREKIVLTLYYYEGLSLTAIGEVLGVSESRVCQIHTKAVLQMRARMGIDVSARLQLETQRAAKGYVIVDGSAKVGHAAPPGQGWATVRSEARSTLA